MSFVQGHIMWSQETFMPFGSAGLFAVAFIESYLLYKRLRK